MVIHDFRWYLNGSETTSPGPVELHPNETRRLQVVLRTDGASELNTDSVRWAQKTVRPDPAPRLAPALTLERLPPVVKGSAAIFTAVVRAPGTTGTYPDLEFDVEVEPLSDSSRRLACTVAVVQK